jgi:hypothetical protein
VVPNYTYLKLKMPGPNGVITVSSSFEQAYTCGREHFELTHTLANSVELQQLRRTVMESALDSNKPTSSSAFHPTEDTNDPTKTVRIGAQLPAK